MFKKLVVLALAAASIMMLSLPTVASALEIHLDNTTSFSGSAGASSLAAEGEPTITCESGDVEGTVSAGGTTETFSLDLTGCHTTVFGFTAKCRTSGSPLDNTISTSGVKHFITVSSGVPGSLWTFNTTTYICAGISNTIVHGSLIGTLLFPQCNNESKELTEKFAGSGSSQEDDVYTGATYTLTDTTGEGGAAKAAAFTSTLTTKSETTGKVTCT